MAHIKPDNDAVRRSQKMQRVQNLKKYLDTLAPIFYQEYQCISAHQQTVTLPKSIEDSPQKAIAQLEVYNTVKALEFTVNPETFTVGINFSDDSGFGCHIENVDIDSQQFCFGFMVFMNTLTHRIMGAMKYHVPTGWCKVEIWKALKDLRNRVLYIFDADQKKENQHHRPKGEIMKLISDFCAYLEAQELAYQKLYVDEYQSSGLVHSEKSKKYYKVYDTIETFNIFTNPEHFSAKMEFFGGPSEFMLGYVDIESQVFCYGVMTFVNTITYRIISALAIGDNTCEVQEQLSNTLNQIREFAKKMFYL